jgi:hypothetical protein
MHPMPEVLDVLDQISRRLERLEAAAAKPRRALNSREAAEYLGRSDEWLRLQRLAGKGPRYRKRGKFYDYNVSDLDNYRDNGDV